MSETTIEHESVEEPAGGAIPTAASDDLLRRRSASLAVVCDDTGHPTGMVSLDDLLACYLQPQAA
ncbi:hypothetical protein ACFU6I_22130 [Streptomyces sp. NPDC057486]|uniref:hypothetical protein n=1 Tax=Streptomyces sp. NPDC057486 TaxID=3346145 RepID=UPI0036A88CB3